MLYETASRNLSSMVPTASYSRTPLGWPIILRYVLAPLGFRGSPKKSTPPSESAANMSSIFVVCRTSLEDFQTHRISRLCELRSGLPSTIRSHQFAKTRLGVLFHGITTDQEKSAPST